MVDRFVVLAASLGGPHLVNAILSALDEEYSLPVIVFQQMEHDFSEPLSGAWGKTCSLNVVRLSQKSEVGRSTVYIMPHGAALTLERTGSKLLLVPTFSSATMPAAELWKAAVRTTLEQLSESDILVLLSDAPEGMEALRTELVKECGAPEVLVFGEAARERSAPAAGGKSGRGDPRLLSIDRIVGFLNALSAETRNRPKSEFSSDRRARV